MSIFGNISITTSQEILRMRAAFQKYWDFAYQKYAAPLAPASRASAMGTVSDMAHNQLVANYMPDNPLVRSFWNNDPYNFAIRLAADKGIPAGEAETIFLRRKKVLPIWKRAPWPEINGKDWYARCARASRLDGNFAFKEPRFYSNYNAEFWKTASRYDELDWEVYFAFSYSDLIDGIGECVLHKAEKWARGKARTAMWSGVVGGAVSLVLPAGMNWAVGLLQKSPQQFNQEIAMTIASIGNIPDYLVPLYEYWLRVMRRWMERGGKIDTQGRPEPTITEPEIHTTPIKGGAQLPVVATVSSAGKFPVIILVAVAAIGALVILASKD